MQVCHLAPLEVPVATGGLIDHPLRGTWRITALQRETLADEFLAPGPEGLGAGRVHGPRSDAAHCIGVVGEMDDAAILTVAAADLVGIGDDGGPG